MESLLKVLMHSVENLYHDFLNTKAGAGMIKNPEDYYISMPHVFIDLFQKGRLYKLKEFKTSAEDSDKEYHEIKNETFRGIRIIPSADLSITLFHKSIHHLGEMAFRRITVGSRYWQLKFSTTTSKVDPKDFIVDTPEKTL